MRIDLYVVNVNFFKLAAVLFLGCDGCVGGRVGGVCGGACGCGVVVAVVAVAVVAVANLVVYTLVARRVR